MSFIYDNKQLINLLILEGSKSLDKFAQGAPPSTDTYQLAKTLLVGLQRDIDPLNAPPTGVPISVEKGAPTDKLDATTTDLRTLGDFLQWAASKKLTWNGKRFAWGAGEPHPEDAWQFTVYKTDRSNRNLVTRKPEPITAFAAKPELISYLTYLRDGPAKTNKVLQVMLSKIIGQTNEFLLSAGEKGMDAKAKPEAEKPTYNPESIVDALPGDTLDPKNPLVGITSYPTFTGTDPANQLKIKDLLDLGAFISWLKFKKIVTGKGTPYIMNPDGDPCTALNVLAQRAQYLSSVALSADKTVPNYSKMVTMYVNQLKELSKKYTTQDGNPCMIHVSGVTAELPGAGTGKAGPSTGEGEEVAGKGTVSPADAKAASQILDQMVNALPLDIQDIDFHRIQAFFGLYSQLLEHSTSTRKTEIQNAINIALPAMQRARSLTVGGKNSFSMFAGPSEVVQWLQPPQGDKYMSFLAYMKTVLDATKTVLDNFYASYVRAASKSDKVVFDYEQRAEVEAQILGENSIYKNNWNKLRALEARRNEVLSFK